MTFTSGGRLVAIQGNPCAFHGYLHLSHVSHIKASDRGNDD